MNKKQNTLVAMGFSALLSASTAVVAAVPHTFTAGEAARAAEVNNNFNNLDTRVTAVETASGDNTTNVNGLEARVTALESFTQSSTDFDGFTVPFAADGAQKNVVVLLTVHPDNSRTYSVRSRYQNSTEQISVNGTPTVRPFIANYAFVNTNSGGTITSITNSVEAPDTLAYTNSLIENSTYDPSSLVKTVTSDTTREQYHCSGAASVAQCIVTRVQSNGGAYVLTTDFSSIQSVLQGPLTVGPGMTFTQELRHESYISTGYSSQTTRIRAKGIGEIYRAFRDGNNNRIERRVIYYHSNGTTGGSLTGTPFDAGQPLAGLFF